MCLSFRLIRQRHRSTPNHGRSDYAGHSRESGNPAHRARELPGPGLRPANGARQSRLTRPVPGLIFSLHRYSRIPGTLITRLLLQQFPEFPVAHPGPGARQPGLFSMPLMIGNVTPGSGRRTTAGINASIVVMTTMARTGMDPPDTGVRLRATSGSTTMTAPPAGAASRSAATRIRPRGGMR
jgi:hypothetical protein